ncbi:hypothetical protein ACTFIR_011783 [Dictyostelium discoideum]
MGKQTASKRQSLHHKHKVLKKVAEHHRKVKRFAKQHPELNKSRKDPGIPNLWPFKEDMLNKIEQQKQKASEEKKNKKEKRRLEQMAEARRDIASMAADAKRRESEFQERQQLKQQQKQQGKFEKEGKDSSLKQFYREVKKVIEAGDVILQVLDARDPMGCRCLEIEKMILERYTNKKIVLILNKIDLVPRENVLMWLKYLRNFYPTLAFKCSTQQQKRNLGQQGGIQPELASNDMLNSTESLGAEQLLQLLKNYSRSLNIKTSVTVGIIGYPNVGKSSLINSLKRTRSVGVGATPGFTKFAQEVHLDKNVKLLDSPGIVPIKGNVDENIILRNVVKLEKVLDPIAPVDAILSRCSQKQILDIYEIAQYQSTTDFLTQVAAKRKKIVKGGIADLRSTAISVIRDWTGGKIPFYTQPPKVLVKSTLLSQFSDELNIDQSDLISTVSNQNTSFASLKYLEPKQQELDNSLFDDDDEDDEDEEEMEDEDEEDDDDEEEEEMEDEDEEDEEDEDEMEEDSDSEALLKYQQQKQVVKATAKQVAQIKSKSQNLKDENDQFNPQSNKQLKKQNKKLKKKFGIVSTSSKQVQGDDDDDEDDDDEQEEIDQDDDEDDEEDIDEDEAF